jgi:hypothetical protein
MRKLYKATVHLSMDFRRTCFFIKDDGFEKAAADGVYDGDGFTFDVLADSHLEAAEVVFAVCNSSPGELHCEEAYFDRVQRYREKGNRSLSTGDIVMLRRLGSPDDEDGRYGVKSFGFERF